MSSSSEPGPTAWWRPARWRARGCRCWCSRRTRSARVARWAASRPPCPASCTTWARRSFRSRRPARRSARSISAPTACAGPSRRSTARTRPRTAAWRCWPAISIAWSAASARRPMGRACARWRAGTRRSSATSCRPCWRRFPPSDPRCACFRSRSCAWPASSCAPGPACRGAGSAPRRRGGSSPVWRCTPTSARTTPSAPASATCWPPWPPPAATACRPAEPDRSRPRCSTCCAHTAARSAWARGSTRSRCASAGRSRWCWPAASRSAPARRS